MGFALTTQTLLAQVPSYVPTNGLVGYWPFNGNANDESVNANNGTNNGAILTTDRYGNSNNAYSFDGLNSEIIVPNNPSLNLENNNQFTFSYWINVAAIFPTGISFVIIKQTGGGLNQDGYNSGVESIYSSSCRIQNGPTSSSFTFGSFANTIPTNSWIFVCQVWDGNHGKTYLNNILVSDLVGSAVAGDNLADLRFGKSALTSSSGRGLDGKIDDIGIWNRALTQQEITNLFNANQCITNITVTDTLIINVGQLSFNEPVTWANNITIAPNPASSQININFNNITNLNGGTLKVINSLGQEVASTPITTSGTNSTMQLATWGGTGMYFVQIINPQGQIVDIKKIILQ